MTRFAIRRVTATPAAIDLVEQLSDRHGPLAFFLAEHSTDGAPAMCLTKPELLPSPSDVKVGEIGGSPLYVDSDDYESWGRPTLLLDVEPGAAGRRPLEGLESTHFVCRSVDRVGVPG